MSAQTDFFLTLDRAAGLTLDATCAVRAAAARPLPNPLEHRVRRLIGKLEGAQQEMFSLRQDPWPTAGAKKPRQMELL